MIRSQKMMLLLVPVLLAVHFQGCLSGALEKRNEVKLDENGNPMEYGEYLNGQREGLWTYYGIYSDGEEYKVEESYEHGELHGERRMYYDNGQLRLHEEYKKGLRWNVYGWYTKEGDTLEVGSFRDGNGNLYTYGMTGIALTISDYKDGKRTGYKYADPSVQKMSEELQR